MTKIRFYEPVRLSTPTKPLFSLKLVEVIVILGLPSLQPWVSRCDCGRLHRKYRGRIETPEAGD